jgi:hypothetical protein
LVRITPTTTQAGGEKNIEYYQLKAAILEMEGQQIFMAAVFTFHTDKAIVQITAIEITIDDLLEVGTEEYLDPLELFLVHLDEGFQMILDAAIIIGSLWIAGPIHGGWGGHDSLPPRKTGRLFYWGFPLLYGFGALLKFVLQDTLFIVKKQINSKLSFIPKKRLTLLILNCI